MNLTSIKTSKHRMTSQDTGQLSYLCGTSKLWSIGQSAIETDPYNHNTVINTLITVPRGKGVHGTLYFKLIGTKLF